MVAIAIGAAFAPAASPAAAAAGAPAAVAPTSTAGPTVTAPDRQRSGSAAWARGLDQLEALALLALLSGTHQHRRADALEAMSVALALNAYLGVQSMGGQAAGPSGVAAGGTRLNLQA